MRSCSKAVGWFHISPAAHTTARRLGEGRIKGLRRRASRQPTHLHEIRALGAWLYEQQGFEQEYIQGLMGHADVKMTEHYQAGHGDDAVVYMKVKADLKV